MKPKLEEKNLQSKLFQGMGANSLSKENSPNYCNGNINVIASFLAMTYRQV
jgi:hypothetical protein